MERVWLSPLEMEKQEIGGATGSASSHRNLVLQKHTTLKTSKQKQANNINKQHITVKQKAKQKAKQTAKQIAKQTAKTATTNIKKDIPKERNEHAKDKELDWTPHTWAFISVGYGFGGDRKNTGCVSD